MPSVLIIDDEPNIRRMVGALLNAEGYDVREASNGADGILSIADDEPDVALLDLMMPGELDGIATLTRLRERWADLPVVMMSGRASLGDAVRATKLGAVNFLEKPLAPETVLLSLSSALELRRTRRAARALREELGLTGNMVGSSAVMQQVRDVIERVAPTESRVLIMGESGTGKELVAAAIHDRSPRRDKPFVRVNCAAIPRDLVESEMFGHEKGSFTGATSSRNGKFELAHTGTLFLDEIGDLNVEAQAKLLRAIEAREIQRVGGNRTIKVDVRVIAATNKDLARAVSEGTFREDLYFRLNVLPIALPPLRDRGDDVIELIQHFSLLQRQRTGTALLQWSDDALAAMQAYPWPGNVRELANIVERLAILNNGSQIRASDIHAALPHRDGTPSSIATATATPNSTRSLTDALDDTERTLINDALARADGSVAEAARQLQTDRPNLYRRMKRLGITGVMLAMLVFPVAAASQARDSTAPKPSLIDCIPMKGAILPDSTSADSIATDSIPLDSIPADSATTDSLWKGLSKPRYPVGIKITSGKTYNRVEGMPILFGPTLGVDGATVRVRASVMGIIRTVGPIRLAEPDGGYDIRLATRFGKSEGKSFVFGVGAEAFNIVSPVERWQTSEPEVGLATLLFHRDFLDYYNRHGSRLTLGWYGTRDLSVIASYSRERWKSRALRDPYSVFRGGQSWRENPDMDEGVFNLITLNAVYDSRNDERAPSQGWYATGTFEYGHSGDAIRGPRDASLLLSAPTSIHYSRLFFDVRRYMRISPRSQINARVVAGGWLAGDELPLQRKLSVSGPGVLPGYDFRVSHGTQDVQTCSRVRFILPGRPALCDRIVLTQLEFRTDLASRPFGIMNKPPMRMRPAGFTTRPAGLVFVDVGRGWRTTENWPSSYKADMGAGIDLGFLGFYVAKSISDWPEPLNFFMRVQRRF